MVASGAVTLTELLTSFTTVDATSGTCTGNAAYPMVYTDGTIYGVAGKSTNDGFVLWKQKNGGSMTTATIPESFCGDDIVVNLLSSYTGSYTFAFHRHPIALLYGGGQTWYLVALQKNSGNWKPTLYRSTDDWANWSKIGVLNGIDTGGQHTELQFSANYHFNGKGIFHYSKATSSTLSLMYIRDANNLTP